LLVTELRDTEQAHKDASSELDRMRDTMEKMELERAEMVAEVEAQIERALASMAVGMDDSDYGSSRSHSRLSNVSGSSASSRRPSDSSKSRYLRSFATESTLAESYDEEIEEIEEAPEADQTVKKPISRETSTIVEDDEAETTSSKKKRFSASDMEIGHDGMTAVDEGISSKSEKIAQKVLEIQHKVCFCGL
jgi:nicotinamide N-methyltransferase